MKLIVLVALRGAQYLTGDLIVQNLSTQDHAELGLLLNLVHVGFFVSARTKWWAEMFCSIEIPAL